MIDPLRHLPIFKPHAFGNRLVDIIGVGATGSRIALSIAKLGITNIRLWDPDIVERHNIANQSFCNEVEDIGKYKVDVMAKTIKDACGTVVGVERSRVDGTQNLGEVVFLLVDTMKDRKKIWEGSLKLHLTTGLVIETRMGVEGGRIYAINPCLPSHIGGWEGTLYTDDEVVDTLPCGASVTAGPTAEIVSGMAVWQLINWAKMQLEDTEDLIENEVIFSLRPYMFLTRKF